MPTGYTAAVQDGEVKTLAQFTRECARAFILDLRDEALDAPIPRKSECQASGLKMYRNMAAATLNEIHRLHGLSAADAEREAADDYAKETDRLRERLASKQQSRERYTAMLEKVRAWDAPARMAQVRAFMIEQLENSLQFDCSTSSFDVPPERLTGPEWLERAIAGAQENHKRYVEEIAKGEERQRDRDEFYTIVCDEIARLEALPSIPEGGGE